MPDFEYIIIFIQYSINVQYNLQYVLNKNNYNFSNTYDSYAQNNLFWSIIFITVVIMMKNFNLFKIHPINIYISWAICQTEGKFKNYCSIS